MNIAILGRRLQGKSTLALFLARRIQERRGAHVVAIFDPKRSFKSIPHTADLEEFEELMETPGNFAVAFQPSGKSETGEISEQFDAFYDALGIDFHLGAGPQAVRKNLAPFILVVDEVWMLKQGGDVNRNLGNLVRLADGENFFLIQVAHRPVDFATGARSQFDEYFIFKQWLPSDLRIIEDWAGESVAQTVSVLPDHHLVRYEVNSGKVELWDKPEGWKIELKGEPHESAGSDGHADTTAEEAITPGTGCTGRGVEVAVHAEERATVPN